MNRNDWRTWKLYLAWTLALSASGCIVHPHPGSYPSPPPRHAPPPEPSREIVMVVPRVQAEDPRLARCRRDNQEEHAQAMQIYQRAQQAGRISPDEAQRFEESDRQLRHYAAQLGRDGLTLAECEAIGRQIAEEQQLVRRIASNRHGNEGAPVPRKHAHEAASPLAQCSANSQKMRDETRQLYARAHATGNITPMEQDTFEKTEQRLDKKSRELARDGMTLPECEALAREAAEQSQRVERMAGVRSRTSSR